MRHLLRAKSAGVARDYSRTGFILGTGTNRRMSSATRGSQAHGPRSVGSMVINVESGAFRRVQQSVFDATMDAQTIDSRHYTFEKMTRAAISAGWASRFCALRRRPGFSRPKPPPHRRVSVRSPTNTSMISAAASRRPTTPSLKRRSRTVTVRR